MTVSVRQILESTEWKAALERVRTSCTQTVMAQATSAEDRATALIKFHLLDELMVDLSMQKQE